MVPVAGGVVGHRAGVEVGLGDRVAGACRSIARPGPGVVSARQTGGDVDVVVADGERPSRVTLPVLVTR